MILSHKNEFCFIKTRKTGSTCAEFATVDAVLDDSTKAKIQRLFEVEFEMLEWSA